MPHVAVKILKNLEAADIAKCLKTNKDFRIMVFIALQWNKRLRNDLDEEVSRMLDASESRLLQPLSGLHSDFGFGYNGSLWLFKTIQDLFRPLVDKNGLNLYQLIIYDLKTFKGKKETKLSFYCRARPGVKIMPSSQSKILLQDVEKVILFKECSAADTSIRSYDLICQKMGHNGWSGLYGLEKPAKRFHFGTDPIYSYDWISYELTLYKPLGNDDLVGEAVQLECKPKIVLEKVNIHTLNFNSF